jgi:hypothetical protein
MSPTFQFLSSQGWSARPPFATSFGARARVSARGPLSVQAAVHHLVALCSVFTYHFSYLLYLSTYLPLSRIEWGVARRWDTMTAVLRILQQVRQPCDKEFLLPSFISTWGNMVYIKRQCTCSEFRPGHAQKKKNAACIDGPHYRQTARLTSCPSTCKLPILALPVDWTS